MRITDSKFENIFVAEDEVIADFKIEGCRFLGGVWLSGTLKHGIWVDGLWAWGCWADIETDRVGQIFLTAFWLNGIQAGDVQIVNINKGMRVYTKVSPKAFRKPKLTMAFNYAKYQ